MYLTFWVSQKLYYLKLMVLEQLSQDGKQPDVSLSFHVRFIPQAFTSLLVFNCSLSESAQEIQGVGVEGWVGGTGEETGAEHLLHFPLTAELLS